MNIDYEELMRTLKKHLWGPVGSVFFHVILLVALLQFAVGTSNEKAPEVEITVMDTKAEKLDQIDEVVKKELEKVETPKEDTVTDRPTDATVSTMDVPADAPGSGMGNADGVGIGSGDPSLAAGFEVAVAKSPLVMKGLYAQRTAAGRKGSLSAFGGSGRGEEAVMRALRWLKANQGPDGSWAKVDPTDPPAMAGLALLCYLAHGETPSSVEFGQTVEKAMKYIVAQQTASGAFGNIGAPGAAGPGIYRHGICTYAIAEGFGLTKIMALKEAMDKGIQVIINGQQAGGGYDYGYGKGARFDLSAAGWQFQAMKAAKMAGCNNDKLEEAIKKSTTFLRTQAFFPGNGSFMYSQGSHSKPSMTGAGVLCLQLLGKPDISEVRAGLKFLENATVVWDPKKDAKNAVYTWYYVTQAKFQKGGKDWQEWNPKFTTALVRNQIVEQVDKIKLGHWEGGDHGGKVYTTTLSCLMLEVYYRYLPTFKHAEAIPDAPAAAAKSDDVVVDVK